MAQLSIKLLCIPCVLAAVLFMSRASGADLGAEVVDTPSAESTSVSALPNEPAPPPPAPEEPPAEIIPLPPSKRSLEQSKPSPAPKVEKAEKAKSTPTETKTDPKSEIKPEKMEPATPNKTIASEARKPSANSCYLKPAEPGYPTVLSGTLTEDLELTPQMSPVLISGTFIVPEKIKLTIQGGTLIRLRGDPQGVKAPGAPDPTQSAVVWIWGTLTTSGATGNPVEFVNLEKADGSLLLYGTNDCKLDGVRLKGMNVAQSGGTALWTNCEFVGSGSYAMAAGAGVFTQCTFRRFGGIFATYDVAPWSLLVRKSLFERCREGIILGSNPGEARLIVEKNHFIGTQGAHIRALPLSKGKATASAADGKKPEDMEVLIGENWYGTSIPEETDLRIVDRRNDPSIHARLNTRPPANAPYGNIGAGMKVAVLEATAKEQQSAVQKLLQAQAAKQKLNAPARQVAKKGT